ncbi:CBO0543 family protein [Niallia taxi]|uniref:CBO0543 family protein n=1 Tax=Niallia taxi TaxID=2499688 RepID=UPI003CCC6CF5
MKIELFILCFSWLFSILLLVIFITKENIRLYLVTFIFTSTLSWIYEYFQLMMGFLEFPWREFSKATKMSFTLHYIVYPTFAVFFIRSITKRNKESIIILKIIMFATLISFFTYAISTFSSLIEYKNWNFLTGVISNIIMLYIVKSFVFWFKRGLIV